MGQLVHTFIIPSNKESPISTSELMDFLTPLLDKLSLPGFITMVDVLPLGAGKVDRIQLSQHSEGTIALKLTP